MGLVAVAICRLSRRKRLGGYLIAGGGLLGIVVSLAMQKSDYDPTFFGIASLSILAAIGGISLILKSLPKDEPAQ